MGKTLRRRAVLLGLYAWAATSGGCVCRLGESEEFQRAIGVMLVQQWFSDVPPDAHLIIVGSVAGPEHGPFRATVSDATMSEVIHAMRRPADESDELAVAEQRESREAVRVIASGDREFVLREVVRFVDHAERGWAFSVMCDTEDTLTALRSLRPDDDRAQTLLLASGPRTGALWSRD